MDGRNAHRSAARECRGAGYPGPGRHPLLCSPMRRSRPPRPSAAPSPPSPMPPRSSPSRSHGGGRLAYAAAGSSGLMALADALELPGTYGIPRDRIAILIAGGDEALRTSGRRPGGRHRRRPRAPSPTPASARGDCLIAVSASGSTPYAVRRAATKRARRGAATIAIANNAGTPLLRPWPTSPILLATPPEVIAGSTRMGAGTAQKIALNMLSTLAAIHLGHVHDGYMVNLIADNIKLRDRAAAHRRRHQRARRRTRPHACSNKAAARSRPPFCSPPAPTDADAADEDAGRNRPEAAAGAFRDRGEQAVESRRSRQNRT